MIYLDNSATTRPFDEVIEYVSHVMKDVFGNPSSLHMAGVDAEKEVRSARETIANILKVDPKEIVWQIRDPVCILLRQRSSIRRSSRR